ncbi:hypothetical protein Taro_013330 [Colocasia esculenta]|uniref:Uncharacterized protein n=1 Tax=Colocasia esculenta TaxID=4460 RepID=A0A843UF97_COLES|nr:hypothetical protein [Colocasia esculenta]
MQTQAHTQAALQAQLEAQTGGRDAVVSGREEGFAEEACSYVPVAGQEESSVPGTAISSNNQRCTGTFSTFPWCEEGVSPLREDTWWYRVLDDCGKVLEVRKQRPQDQGLTKTSAGSPARSTSPSSGSSSSASYRKTRKASSPSSILDEVIDQQKADPRLLDLVAKASKAGIARDEDASSGDLQQLEASLDIGGGFPDHRLEATTPQNPEESPFGGFLGMPKESFNDTFDPFGDLLRGNIIGNVALMRRNTHSLLRRIGLVGDPTPLEETVESDSERGE